MKALFSSYSLSITPICHYLVPDTVNKQSALLYIHSSRPANRIFNKSSGCTTKVETRPPLTPAIICSYCTRDVMERFPLQSHSYCTIRTLLFLLYSTV